MTTVQSSTLAKLVENLTTSDKNSVDESKLKELKKLCKSSEENVKHAFHLVMHQLQKDHAEVRMNSLIIINELFHRSHIFRDLLVSDLQDFFELTVETDPDLPLPPPKTAAKELKKKTLSYFQSWFKKYGEAYKKLSLGYNFLKNCKKFNFDDIEARSVIERQQEEIRRKHAESVLKKKYDVADAEFLAIKSEIEDNITQLENCFRLLLPHPDEFFVKNELDSVDHHGKEVFDINQIERIGQNTSTDKESCDASTSASSYLDREHGLGSKYAISIKLTQEHLTAPVLKNSDTEPVIENSRDLYKLIVQKYKPALQKIINTFTRSGMGADNLKLAIDIKHKLHNAIDKFRELNIPDLRCESDDDDFEEVPDKEGYEPDIPENLRGEYGLEPLNKSPRMRTPQKWILGKYERDDVKDPTTALAQPCCSKSLSKSSDCEPTSTSRELHVDETKAKLLKEAPKVRYDTDLYVWNEEKLEAPIVEKYDSIHRFWSPQETDLNSFLKNKDVDALRHRVIDFSGDFTPVKWSCRAPLPNGKLCPRRDRKKCPFHGTVIARDEIGKPSNESDAKELQEKLKKEYEDVPDWQDPKLLADIESQTGINLKIEVKKKGRGKGKKVKKSNLTDIKAVQNTVRSRLEKKVLDRKLVKKVELLVNSEKQKLYDDKFGDQWCYSYRT